MNFTLPEIKDYIEKVLLKILKIKILIEFD